MLPIYSDENFYICRCKFYIERKKRFCKTEAHPGKKFCIEHATPEDNKENQRIPCPYDPKHTCYVTKLKKHLKKCNARPQELPEYIVPKLNFFDVEDEGPNALEGYSITTVPDDVLLDLIKKIERIYENLPICSTNIAEHEIMVKVLEEESGMNARKHLIQNSSLLKNMEENGLFGDNFTFVEFGAGRGLLSYWINHAISDKKNCSLVLIDRASTRHKSDNKLKGVSDFEILRIRSDIADIDLSKMELLQNSQNKIVGVSKHLCGIATDLALRCIVNAKLKGLNIYGIVMAFCCHHRCSWKSFVGKDFIQAVGFDPNHFQALCSVSSWATCGSGKPRKSKETTSASQENKDRYGKLGLDQGVREGIGRKCKMILNYARLKYLERFGFDGKLVYYVEQGVSPENVCLLAKC